MTNEFTQATLCAAVSLIIVGLLMTISLSILSV
jgi:hypothetical protein